jgi:lysophospholipase II
VFEARAPHVQRKLILLVHPALHFEQTSQRGLTLGGRTTSSTHPPAQRTHLSRVCDSTRLEAGRGREAGGRRCTGRGRQAGGGRPEAEDGLRRRLRAEAEGGIYEAEDGRANHFEDFGRPRGVARDYVPRSPQRVFLLPRHPTARAATTWNGLLACPESPTRLPRGPFLIIGMRASGMLSLVAGLRPAARSLMSASTVPPRVTQDRDRGGLITIAPGEGIAHTATVVGPIHGLGDTNMGWLDVAGHLQQALPYCKFILPNAPVSPVTLNGGMSMPSWYDITSLDDRAKQPCTGIEESRATVTELIEQEVASGIDLERIVVAGFSQGGAMSLYAGLQYPGQLGGVLVMSGYLARAEAFELAAEAVATPVKHFHGVDDPTVRIEWARASARQLGELGVRAYDLVEYDGLGHSASVEEIAAASEWLQARLPAT